MMELRYPQGYGTDPLDCSFEELHDQLSRFSFTVCGMRHELSPDPMAAAESCNFTQGGFNLGCAHSGVRKGYNDKLYLMDMVRRFFDEDLIDRQMCHSFIRRIKIATDLLYTIDILQRRAQSGDADWRNSQSAESRKDRRYIEETLKSLEPGSLPGGIIQRTYNSFNRSDHDAIQNAGSDHEFMRRIRISQILVSADLLKIPAELKEIYNTACSSAWIQKCQNDKKIS